MYSSVGPWFHGFNSNNARHQNDHGFNSNILEFNNQCKLIPLTNEHTWRKDKKFLCMWNKFGIGKIYLILKIYDKISYS